MRKINHKEKLKIAMLGHKRIPSREGGIEVVVEELATRMVGQGHKVTCYNRGGHHVSGKKYDENKSCSYKGIIIKTVWTIDRRGLAAVTSSFFAAVCTAFGHYDVVHFHAEGPCAFLWIPKLFGKKCVATVHGLDHKRSKWGDFAKWYILGGERCAVKYADEIIVLSKSVQRYFKEQYGRDTIYIPNGVNKPIIQRADKIKKLYGLEKDEYILFLGRLVPEKGVQYLIEAYRNINTDKRLVIAGGSSDTEAFEEELHKLAKDDRRILFTGFVQGRILEELYSNAYIYVLPSDIEGMPLSLLEAMSHGNCCLVSNIEECVEVTADCAATFQNGCVADLKKQLQRLCEDEMLVQKYKAEVSAYILKKYSWDDVVEKTLLLYTGSEI